ncbi:MAG: UDP-3-O-[3-hydroxymyristoyl] N-acetylglucosamine deacetylase [Deltaproteobacteria bacterium GWC2_55_46]|nr:MAG: UDP-3-O-[3-hydroxymyristoyl] N-acetylglucosamine deacetylase [Deltaproteobacteria bacterium GWA2_55_82]OGQ61977.1 MAG: UDP-3-O-[3-hydroxymyristoyl] N-acetylglucosamine deacetylase [Deltaproteobacteria bacterium RIFCSPLOWO2_02_FULL_55_12]OIJ74672.1 MAG: UDP-3-O-[3-hydroxymyristoyl] N-acetylglucosamine deacetylase [Deltaproteobacteria bacterium GWC2_55_46]
MMMQQTLRNVIEFSGVGLHTGCEVSVRILPSCGDTGITFFRRDLPGSSAIRAVSSNVTSTSYATSLGSRGATVSTIEHLMAAFYGMGVDNAIVELNGPEVPIMDGSAAEFVGMVESAGLVTLSTPRRYMVIKKPIKVVEDDKYIFLMPSEEAGLSINYAIDFSHPFLAKQSFSRPFSKDVFRKELGSARTFGFLKDVEMLRANGLARGGSLENAIVISDTEILNEGGLRYPDEFVRHKVLDLMGDISLVGAPIMGKLIAYRSGHALNHKLAQEIWRKPGRWEFSDLSPVEDAVFAPSAALLEKMATI